MRDLKDSLKKQDQDAVQNLRNQLSALKEYVQLHSIKWLKDYDDIVESCSNAWSSFISDIERVKKYVLETGSIWVVNWYIWYK